MNSGDREIKGLSSYIQASAIEFVTNSKLTIIYLAILLEIHISQEVLFG